MELNWNKLLLFLGLLSFAVSKSHNHRFPTDIYEYGFESRRMGTSQSSAKPRPITRRIGTFLPRERLQNQYTIPEALVSEIDKETKVEQPSTFIKRMFIEESEPQLSISDESDGALEITPEELHYESKRLQNIPKPKLLNKDAGIFKKHSKLYSEKYDNVWLASEKQQEEITSPEEAIASTGLEENAKKVIKKQETKEKILQTVKNGKTKRRKVLRVRKRQGIKNKNNETKIESKINQEQTQTNTNINTDEKNQKENRVKSDAQKLSFKKSLPTVNRETQREQSLPTELPHATAKDQKSTKNANINYHKEVENKQRNPLEMNLPEQKNSTQRKDYLVTFFRRIGKKLLNDHKPVKQTSKPEWVSMFATEDRNANNNYYVQSFNYRGGRNNEAKDLIKLTQWTPLRNQPQKKAFELSEKKIRLEKVENYKPHDARSYKSEKNVDHNFEGGKNPVKWNRVTNFKTSGINKKNLEDIREEQLEEEVVSKVLTENDKAKLDMASISFKKKSINQSRKPQWQPGEPVQISRSKPLKRKIKFNENASERENYENPYVEAEEPFGHSFLEDKEEDMALKAKNDEPVLSNYDQNLKSTTTKSAPSFSLGNENGKYFVHVFRRMGEISKEDFDINSDEIPEGDGYISSMKLSWDDDDTKAQIERAIDSRPRLPSMFKQQDDFFTSVDENISILEDMDKKARGNEETAENMFTHRSSQKDDLLPSSTEDGEYHSENMDYIYRKKRSAMKTPDPYVKSHFTIGNSKTTYQSTLPSNKTSLISSDKHQKPTVSSRRSANTVYVIPSHTHSRNAVQQSELNNDKRTTNFENFRSYYHKPEQLKEMRKLTNEFHTEKSTVASPFDKYSKPTRKVKSYQIFHSYREPQRDLKQPQIQIFYNNKNTDAKKDQKIFNKSHIKRLQRLKPSFSNLQGNKNGLMDIPETEVIQSPTDINKSYFKQIKNGENIDNKEIQDEDVPSVSNPNRNKSKSLLELRSDKILTESNTDDPKIKKLYRKSGQAVVRDEKRSFSEYDTTGDTRSNLDENDKWPYSEKLHHGKERKEYIAENDDVENNPRNSPTDAIFLPHEDQNDYSKNSLNYRKEEKAKPTFHFESNEWKNLFNSPEEAKYPRFHSIPKTHFTCREKKAGYYADPETECQVFHMCQATGEKHSFLCPNTTVFNQKLLVCDWYSKVNCEKSELFYSINDHIYEQKSSDKEMTSPRYRDENNWNSKLRQIEADVERKHSENRDTLPRTAELQTEDEKLPYFEHTDFNDDKTTDSTFKNTEYKSFARKSNSKDYDTKEGIEEVDKTSRNRENEDNLAKEKPLKSKGFDYYKEDEYVYLHKKAEPENVADKLSTSKPTFSTNEYRIIKNSWDEKELQKTIHSQLKSTPESIRNTYDNVNSENPYSALENQALQHEDSFRNEDEPQVTDFKSDDKEHKSAVDEQVSFPSQEKNNIILIHKTPRHTDNDSSESRESLERKPLWNKKNIVERPSQTVQRTRNARPVYYARKKYLQKSHPGGETARDNVQDTSNSNANSQENEMPWTKDSDAYRNSENIDHEVDNKIIYLEDDERIPRYIYPLPGIIQNDDGSREYNYGFRVEDPRKINLQDAHIFKITFHDPNTELKTGSQINYNQPDVKLHKEIFNNNENIHKNVRIYKLKSQNSPDETQEIRLAPFIFERQAEWNPQVKINNKNVERKSLTKVPKIVPTTIQNYDADIKTKTQVKNIVLDKSFGNAQSNVPYGSRSKQTIYDYEPSNPNIPTNYEKMENDKHRHRRPENVMPIHDYKENNGLREDNRGQRAYGHTVKIGPLNQKNSEILSNIAKAKSLLLKYKQPSQNSDLYRHYAEPNLQPYGYTVQVGPFSKVMVPSIKNTEQFEDDKDVPYTIPIETVKPVSAVKEILTTKKSNYRPLSHDKHIINENPKLYFVPNKNNQVFTHLTSPDATNARNNQDQTVKLIPLTKEVFTLDTQGPMLEKQNSRDVNGNIVVNQKHYQGHLHRIPELRNNKRNNVHEIYYKTPSIQETNREKFVNSHTSQRPRNSVARVQPNVNNRNVFTDEAKFQKETGYSINQNSESHSAISSSKQQIPLESDEANESFECEDESDSSQNTFNPKDLQLGKNGPAHKIITNAPLYNQNVKKPEAYIGGKTLKGDKSFYKESSDNSESRCNDHSSSKESSSKIPEPNYNNAKEKFLAGLLKPKVQKRPAAVNDYSKQNVKSKYPPFPGTQTHLRSNKLAKEVQQVRIQNRPIKLFNLQRSSRPAIPNYVSKTKTALNDEQIPETKLNNDEIRIKNMAHMSTSSLDNTQEEKSSEESSANGDEKSAERSKRVAEGRNSKYADLEKAAELKAEQMIKSKKHNEKK